MAVLRRRAGGDSPLEVPEWLALGTSFQGGFYEGLGAQTPLQIQGSQGRRGVESFAAGLLERMGPSQWGITGWGAAGSEDLGFYQFADLSFQPVSSAQRRQARNAGSYGFFPGLASVAWLLPERSLPTEPVVAPRLRWGRFSESRPSAAPKGLLSQGEAKRRSSQINKPLPSAAASAPQAPAPRAQSTVVTPKARPVVHLSAADRGFVAPAPIEPELEQLFEGVHVDADLDAFADDAIAAEALDVAEGLELTAEGLEFADDALPATGGEVLGSEDADTLPEPDLGSEVAPQGLIQPGAPKAAKGVTPQGEAAPVKVAAPVPSRRRAPQSRRAQAQASLLRAALQGGRPATRSKLPTVRAGLRGGLRPLAQGALIQSPAPVAAQSAPVAPQGPRFAQIPSQVEDVTSGSAIATAGVAPQAAPSVEASTSSVSAAPQTSTPPASAPSRPAAAPAVATPSVTPVAPAASASLSPTPAVATPTKAQAPGTAPSAPLANASSNASQGVSATSVQTPSSQVQASAPSTPDARATDVRALEAPLAAAASPERESGSADTAPGAPTAPTMSADASPLGEALPVTAADAASAGGNLAAQEAPAVAGAPLTAPPVDAPVIVQATRRGTRAAVASPYLGESSSTVATSVGGRSQSASSMSAPMGLSATLEVGQGHLLRAAQAAAQLTIGAPDLRQTGFTTLVGDDLTPASPGASGVLRTPPPRRGLVPPQPSLGSLLSGEAASAPVEAPAAVRIPYAQIPQTQGLAPVASRALAPKVAERATPPAQPEMAQASGDVPALPKEGALAKGTTPAAPGSRSVSSSTTSAAQATPAAQGPSTPVAPTLAPQAASPQGSIAAAPTAPVIGTRRTERRAPVATPNTTPWSQAPRSITSLDPSADVRRAVAITSRDVPGTLGTEGAPPFVQTPGATRARPQGHLPLPLVSVGPSVQGDVVATPPRDTRRRIGPQRAVQPLGPAAPGTVGTVPVVASSTASPALSNDGVPSLAPQSVFDGGLPSEPMAQGAVANPPKVSPESSPFQGSTRLGQSLNWLSTLGAPERSPTPFSRFELGSSWMGGAEDADAAASVVASPVRLRSAQPPSVDGLVSAEGLPALEQVEDVAPAHGGPVYAQMDTPSADAPITASQALASQVAAPERTAQAVAAPQRPQVSLSRRAPGLPQPASSPLARQTLPRLTAAQPAVTSARSQAVMEQVRGQMVQAGMQAMVEAAVPLPAQSTLSAPVQESAQGPQTPTLDWFDAQPQVVTPAGSAQAQAQGGATFQWADLIASRLGAIPGVAATAEGVPGSLGDSFTPRSLVDERPFDLESVAEGGPLQRRVDIAEQLEAQGIALSNDALSSTQGPVPEAPSAQGPVQVRQRAFAPIAAGELLSGEGMALGFDAEGTRQDVMAPRGLRSFTAMAEASARGEAIVVASGDVTGSTPSEGVAPTGVDTPAVVAASAPVPGATDAVHIKDRQSDPAPSAAPQGDVTPLAANAPEALPLPAAAVAPQRRRAAIQPRTSSQSRGPVSAPRVQGPRTTRQHGALPVPRRFGVLPEVGDLLPNQLRWLGAGDEAPGAASKGVGASRGRDIRRAASQRIGIQARSEGARAQLSAAKERVAIPGRRRGLSPEALVRGLDDLITAEGIIAPTVPVAGPLGLRQSPLSFSQDVTATPQGSDGVVQTLETPLQAREEGTSAPVSVEGVLPPTAASVPGISAEGLTAPVKVVRRQLESIFRGDRRPATVLAELRSQGIQIEGIGNAPFDPTLEPEAFLAAIDGVDILESGAPAIRFRGDAATPGTPRVLRARGSGEYGHLPLPLTVLTPGELSLGEDGGWTPWMGEGDVSPEGTFGVPSASPVEAQRPTVQLRDARSSSAVPAARSVMAPRVSQPMDAPLAPKPTLTAPGPRATSVSRSGTRVPSQRQTPWSRGRGTSTVSGIDRFKTTVQTLPQSQASTPKAPAKGGFDWSGLIPANLSWLVGPTLDGTMDGVFGASSIDFSAPVPGEDVALAQPLFGQSRSQRPVVPMDQPLLRAESIPGADDVGEAIQRVAPLAPAEMDTATVPRTPAAEGIRTQSLGTQGRWHLSDQVTARFTEVATRLAAVTSAQSSGPLGAIAQAAQRFLSGQGQSYGGVEAAAMDLIAAGRSVTNTYGMTGTLAAPVESRAPASVVMGAAPLVSGSGPASMSGLSSSMGTSSRSIARPSLGFLFQRSAAQAQSVPSGFSTRAQIPRSPQALPAMMKGVGAGFDALSFGNLLQGAEALTPSKRPINTYPGSPQDTSAGIRAGLGQLRLNTAPQARPQRRPSGGQGIHVPEVSLPTGGMKAPEAAPRPPVTTARTSTPWATRRLQGARESLPSYKPAQVMSRPAAAEEARIAPSAARGISSERMMDFSMSAPLSRALLQAESKPAPAQAYFKERSAEAPGGAQAPMEESQGGQQERPVGLEEVIEEVRWRLQLESRWESELD